jgi:hypothetical protein
MVTLSLLGAPGPSVLGLRECLCKGVPLLMPGDRAAAAFDAVAFAGFRLLTAPCRAGGPFDQEDTRRDG